MGPTELGMGATFILTGFALMLHHLRARQVSSNGKTNGSSRSISISPEALRATDSQIAELKGNQKDIAKRLRIVEHHVIAISAHLKINIPPTMD